MINGASLIEVGKLKWIKSIWLSETGVENKLTFLRCHTVTMSSKQCHNLVMILNSHFGVYHKTNTQRQAIEIILLASTFLDCCTTTGQKLDKDYRLANSLETHLFYREKYDFFVRCFVLWSVTPKGTCLVLWELMHCSFKSRIIVGTFNHRTCSFSNKIFHKMHLLYIVSPMKFYFLAYKSRL